MKVQDDLALKTLVHDVESASLRFNEATGNQVDVAIYELIVAELKLDRYLRLKKSESVVSDEARYLADETVRLMNDYPELTIKEAMDKAKEVLG